jgi:hypothetical protein
MKAFFRIILIVSILQSCSSNSNKNKLIGNWSMITQGEYYEIKIDSYSIIAYHSNFNFWPKEKTYKVINDSFYLDLEKKDASREGYFIERKKKNKIILKSKLDTIVLIKRKKEDFTFDKVNDSIDDEKFKKEFSIRMFRIMDSL